MYSIVIRRRVSYAPGTCHGAAWLIRGVKAFSQAVVDMLDPPALVKLRCPEGEALAITREAFFSAVPAA